jgi:type IV pilus assembly protein PilB
MGLIPWLNRTFRTTFLSAPLASMAGGAEGVSVMRPIEAHGSMLQETVAPAETPVSTDAAAEAVEAKPNAISTMADNMKEEIARYLAANDTESDTAGSASGGYSVEDTPIGRLANTIIQQAIKERASDIHIEPGERNMRVRYRIDGVLIEAMPMPKYLQIPLANRYKVLAGIDMATHRGQPQEGRIPVRYLGVDYNIRVNTLPTGHGDHLTFNICSIEDIQGGFANLGFVPEMQAQLENLALSPRGLLLLTRPTGSGTILQYSVLQYLNSVGVHIATVEERATHTLPGTTQIVVDPSEGGTMASTIRAAILNDIDVLGIGDIRDKATMQAALEAAANSLVVATIRGDSALSTLVRLTEMGFDPGLIAEMVRGVVAQRLVRKICAHCKETYEIPGKELLRFGFAPEDPEENVILARGLGCEYCNRTGYRGRMGLYELFQWEPMLVKMFTDRMPLPSLKEAAFRKDGMHDLKADGLIKILAQVTTPEEVLRVL